MLVEYVYDILLSNLKVSCFTFVYQCHSPYLRIVGKERERAGFEEDNPGPTLLTRAVNPHGRFWALKLKNHPNKHPVRALSRLMTMMWPREAHTSKREEKKNQYQHSSSGYY